MTWITSSPAWIFLHWSAGDWGQERKIHFTGRMWRWKKRAGIKTMSAERGKKAVPKEVLMLSNNDNWSYYKEKIFFSDNIWWSNLEFHLPFQPRFPAATCGQMSYSIVFSWAVTTLLGVPWVNSHLMELNLLPHTQARAGPGRDRNQGSVLSRAVSLLRGTEDALHTQGIYTSRSSSSTSQTVQNEPFEHRVWQFTNRSKGLALQEILCTHTIHIMLWSWSWKPPLS